MRISEQMLYTDTVYDIKENQIEIESNQNKKVIQCFNLEELPKNAAIWQSSENIGKILDASMQLSCPVIINLHLRAVDKFEAKKKAQSQFMMNDNKAHSPMARIMPSLTKKHKNSLIL